MFSCKSKCRSYWQHNSRLFLGLKTQWPDIWMMTTKLLGKIKQIKKLVNNITSEVAKTRSNYFCSSDRLFIKNQNCLFAVSRSQIWMKKLLKKFIRRPPAGLFFTRNVLWVTKADFSIVCSFKLHLPLAWVFHRLTLMPLVSQTVKLC